MKYKLLFILLTISISAYSQQDTTKKDVDFDNATYPLPPPPPINSSPKKVKEEIQYDSNHCITRAFQAYPQKYDTLYLSKKFNKEVDLYVHERLSPSDTIEGKVLVSFKVDTLGIVSEIKIVYGLNPKLDSLVIEGLKDLGDWCPGYYFHKRVAMRMSVLVNVSYKNYYLREEETK